MNYKNDLKELWGQFKRGFVGICYLCGFVAIAFYVSLRINLVNAEVLKYILTITVIFFTMIVGIFLIYCAFMFLALSIYYLIKRMVAVKDKENEIKYLKSMVKHQEKRCVEKDEEMASLNHLMAVIKFVNDGIYSENQKLHQTNKELRSDVQNLNRINKSQEEQIAEFMAINFELSKKKKQTQKRKKKVVSKS